MTRKSLRNGLTLTVSILLALSIPVASVAAQSNLTSVLPSEVIASDLRVIQFAEQQGLPEDKIGYLWAGVASAYERQGDFAKAEDGFNRSLRLFAKVPSARANYGRVMENMGTLYRQYGRLSEAERCYKQALAIGVELKEASEVDANRQHLAEVALAKHHFKQAAREATEVYVKLADKRDADKSIEIAALVTSVYAKCSQHRCAEGSQEAEKAMRLVYDSFPGDSTAIAHVSMATGYAQWKSGAIEDADHSMQEGLRILRLHYDDGHPVLLVALLEYRDYLRSTHRSGEALVEQQLAQANRRRQSVCTACSVSVFSLR